MDEIPVLPGEAAEVNQAGFSSLSLLRSLLALVEIVLVAVLGTVVLYETVSFFGVSSMEILGDTRFLFAFMVCEAALTVALIVLFLHLDGGGLRKLGWVWDQVGREILLAVVFVPVLFASTWVVSTLFQLFLPQYVAVTNPLLEMVRNYLDLMLFMISSIFVGGVKEEIQRAFVLTRFESHLGLEFFFQAFRAVETFLKWVSRSMHDVAGGVLSNVLGVFLRVFRVTGSVSGQSSRRVGLAFGLIVWSVFFGAAHYVQGADNAAGAGVLGFLFGLLYIWRRNLIAPMFAHAIFNVTSLLIFWNS